MLGVTMFGIFLTPIFFTMVDRLGGSRLLHSRLAQWIVFLTLGIFALGFVWMLLRFLGNLLRNRWHRLQASEPPDDADKPH
jgi:Na+-transporting NADH:ubiquinone oxidoreductase subunit NqrB